MRQLEEQLRLSRQREREGLQPPEGGWSALEAKLPELTPSGGAAAPVSGLEGGAMKSSLWLVTVGIFSLVLLVASWSPWMKSKPQQEGEKPLPTTPSLLSEPKVVPFAPMSVPEDQWQNTKEKSNQKSTVAKVTENNRTMLAAKASVGKMAIQAISVEAPPVENTLPSTKLATELPKEKVVITAAIKPLELETVGLEDRLPNVLSILGTNRKPAVEVLTASAEPHLPEFKFSRTRKPKGRVEWQAHLSVSGTTYAYDWGVNYGRYRRATGTGFNNQFILPSGEVIQTVPISNIDGQGRNVFKSALVRFGVDRQLHWGGTFRSSIGYFRSTYRENRNNFSELPDDEVWTTNNNVENAIPLELGFRYTFRRRKRLRSYLELNTLSMLYYRGVQNASFVDGLTQQSGLIRRYESTEYANILSGISLSAGVQYQVNPRMALSAFVWVNGDESVILEAPFGLEVRHSLR
ncbi:MAG: hypothetical protein AAGA31_21820 [Bacteroidota bacterium]